MKGKSVARAGAPKILGLALLLGIPIYVALTGSAQPEAHPGSVVGKVFSFLGKEQFALIFLVVTGGQLLGRIQFKGIGIGATGATLLLALETSVWALACEKVHFEIGTFASTIFFNLFMFAVGLKVGPQFISGMRRNGIKFIVIAIIIPVVSFGLTLLYDRLFHLPQGQAPGLLAGGNTATPGLGAAQNAYTSGAAHVTGDLQEVMGTLSTSFAFSYAITMVLFVILMKVLPGIFRRDAKAEARKYLETSVGGSAPLPGEATAFMVGTLPVATRAYEVDGHGGELIGHTIGELRQAVPMVAVEGVLRGGQTLPLADDLRLQDHDVVALYATVPRLVAAAPAVGHEVDAPELRETRRETVDLVLGPQVAGQKLSQLAQGPGYGVFLNAMFRGGETVPFGPEVVVDKGDVLRVTAGQKRLEVLEHDVGRVVRSSLTTDIVTLGIGLALGALLGAIVVPLGPVKITLGPSVGLLLVGIALGTLRTRYPQLGGPFPEPARKLLEDLGLSIFVAILGLTSGAGVIESVVSGGILTIVIGAIFIGLLPPIIAWCVGLYILKMNTALLLGSVAGGSASAAGLNASQESSASTVPAIAYPVAFAIGNILLTLLSYVVAVMG